MPCTRPDAERGPRTARSERRTSATACLTLGARGLVFLAAAATACGPRIDPGPGSSTPRAAGRTLGAVFQTLDNPFFREVNAGIREIVESNGDTLETLGADWSGPRQNDDLRRLMDGGIAAVFINPVDPDQIRDTLRDAAERNVPCVVVDTQLRDCDGVACQVLSDNREAGRLAARGLCRGNHPRRIVVLHIPTNEACIDRIAGLREIIGRFPDIEIRAVEDGGGTRDAAMVTMTTLLERFPDLDGVFAANDPMALGAAAAVERAGRSATVSIAGVDGSAEGIAAVQAGRLLSTSMQFPREIGRIAAQRAYEILGGNGVEREIRVPVELVTKENSHAFAAAAP